MKVKRQNLGVQHYPTLRPTLHKTIQHYVKHWASNTPVDTVGLLTNDKRHFIMHVRRFNVNYKISSAVVTPHALQLCLIPCSQHMYIMKLHSAKDSKEVTAAGILESLVKRNHSVYDVMPAIVIIRIQPHDKKDCNICQFAQSCTELCRFERTTCVKSKLIHLFIDRL